MFLRAEHPMDPRKPGIFLCLYTSDLAALREHLLANGMTVPPISTPDYMPSGAINFRDPDGNIIEISQWTSIEQQAWEKHLTESPPPSL